MVSYSYKIIFFLSPMFYLFLLPNFIHIILYSIFTYLTGLNYSRSNPVLSYLYMIICSAPMDSLFLLPNIIFFVLIVLHNLTREVIVFFIFFVYDNLLCSCRQLSLLPNHKYFFSLYLSISPALSLAWDVILFYLICIWSLLHSCGQFVLFIKLYIYFLY